jgi:hypothetical protein
MFTIEKDIAVTPHSSTARGDLLYRFEADLEITPIGLVPEGIRLTVDFDGIITAGQFSGGRVWGSDPLLLRVDGVGVIDAHKTITTPEGNLYEHILGYCLPPAGLDMPPAEVLLSPDFQWPDALFPIHGFSFFRTGAPALAHLNRAVARVDGWSSLARGRLAVETRILGHRSEVGAPSGS